MSTWEEFSQAIWDRLATDIDTANARTETNQQNALAATRQFQGMRFGLTPGSVDRYTGEMGGRLGQFLGTQGAFSNDLTMQDRTQLGNIASAAGARGVIGQDRDAMGQMAQQLGQGGTAMADRADMQQAIQGYQAGGQAVNTTAMADRAAMTRAFADHQAQSQGIPREQMWQIQQETKSRLDSQHQEKMAAARQEAAARGRPLSSWEMSRMDTAGKTAINDYLSTQSMEMAIQNTQMQQSARDFYVTGMNQMTDQTRASQLAADQMTSQLREGRDSLGLKMLDEVMAGTRGSQDARALSAAQLGQQGLDSTRGDQLTAEGQATQMAQQAVDGTRGDQMQLEEVREQLRQSGQTDGLAMLDQVLKGGMQTTIADQQLQMTQQQTALRSLLDILGSTSTEGIDPSSMAAIVAALAAGSV